MNSPQNNLQGDIMSNENAYYRRRSLFGPLLLVGIGVLFLLRNIGIIPHLGWWFSRYWPL